MKWLFVLLLAVVIFGGAAFFSYDLFVKPERKIQQEKSGEIPVEPLPDVSLPEFQAAAKLRQEGKLTEARDALVLLLQKYPSGLHVEEAKDLLGEVNTDILLSDYRTPEKQEYIVKRGDVLAKIAAKMKTTPELILRTNRLTHTMLRVGDLDRSIRFYTDVLGMRELRRTDRPEQKYTLAFVGYDDESRAAVLELTYNYGVDHSAGTYVFDAQGRLRLFVSYGQPTEVFVHDIAALLKP